MTFVVIAIVSCLAPSGFRLICESIATFVGIALVVRGHRVERDLLAIRGGLARQRNFDRKPSRAECRILAVSLRSAMRRTEYKSLFPGVMVRVQAMVHTFES